MKECASLHSKFPKAQVHFPSRPFIADSNFWQIERFIPIFIRFPKPDFPLTNYAWR
jgi:hypothetical protein